MTSIQCMLVLQKRFYDMQDIEHLCFLGASLMIFKRLKQLFCFISSGENTSEVLVISRFF